MSPELQVPQAARVFVSFVALLRANGFAVAPEQTTAFLTAIELLGPRHLGDIRQAALATLAPPPERRATFDRLFDLHFRGSEAVTRDDDGEDDETVRLQEEGRGDEEPLLSDDANESGLAATRSEALVERRFAQLSPGDALRRLTREAPRRLPRRRGHRRMQARRGPFADLRRTLRDSVRSDGEVLRLGHLKRRQRPRKILLLIDVSGSMKSRTEENMKLAHALVQAAPNPNVEVFTFGTRLTRVTRALRLKRREQALSAAAHLVSDWDGGTRIGDALQAFLAVPRFGGYARGAAVIVVSDGLERGAPDALRDAVARLSRRAWRMSWLTPLATGPGFRPQTEALVAIERFVDDLVDGGSSASIVAHVLALGRRRVA
ncbi:vWA domain-containing protein [Bradyrhizobium sp. 1200_D9_N1_1]|uniref:vWA domain-containing protein n=1 Tax=Bradyrhizobium sp. 1200_D9_N1_1 TaxID=3239013 RepID=UPI003F88E7AF